MRAEQEKVYLDLKGTHGTSFSRSLQIKRQDLYPTMGDMVVVFICGHLPTRW